MAGIGLILRVIDCALHMVSLNCKPYTVDQFFKVLISSCNFTASVDDCITLKTLVSSANTATRLYIVWEIIDVKEEQCRAKY